MAVNVFELYAKLGLDTSEYDTGLTTAKSSASKFGSKVGSVVKSGLKVATAAVAAGTAGVLAFAKSSIDTGKDFDTAMSQVAATMGTTVDQIGNIKEKAKEMGATTAFTATEAAEGMNILAQSGLKAEEQISTIEPVLNLASAGAMNLASSASYVTGAVKGFGDEMDNAQYYADLMAKGATLANTDVSALGEALSGASATANKYGQEADSVTLSLLRLAEQNVTGSEATTALNRAMADLYTPTTEAKTALDELGISCYDVATGKARDFNDIVNELNEAMSGMTDEQRNATAATIFTTYGLQAFNKMTGTSTEKLDEFKKGLSDATGSAAQQAATQLDNLAGDLTLMDSALDGLKLSFYDTFDDAPREVVQTATKYIEQLNNALNAGGYEGFFDELSNVAEDASQKIAGKIPQIVAVGGKLAIGLAKGVVQAIPTVASSAAGLISGFIDQIAEKGPDAVSETTNTVGKYVPQVMQSIAGFIGENAPKLVDAAVDMISTFASGIPEGLPALLAQVLPTVLSFSEGLKDNAGKLIDAGLNLLMSLAEGIANSLPVLIEYVPKIITNIADIINENAPKLIVTAGVIILKLAEGLIKAIPTLIKNIPAIIKAIVSVWTAFNWLNLGKSVVESIKKAIDKLPDTAKAIIKKAVDGIKSTFTGGGIGNVVKTVINGVKTTISNGMTAAKNAVTSVLDGIRNAFQNKLDTAKNVVSSAINKIKGLFKFSWSLPKLKLPHPYISGKFSLNPPSVPSFGIRWYKKAMAQPYLLNDATIFGASGNTLLGGGEAGSEMIVGTQTLKDMISEGNGDIAEALAALADTLSVDNLAKAFIKALAASGFAIKLDNREVGRLVRRYV